MKYSQIALFGGALVVLIVVSRYIIQLQSLKPDGIDMPNYSLMIDEILQKGQDLILPHQEYDPDEEKNERENTLNVPFEKDSAMKSDEKVAAKISDSETPVSLHPALKMIEEMRIANEKKFSAKLAEDARTKSEVAPAGPPPAVESVKPNDGAAQTVTPKHQQAVSSPDSHTKLTIPTPSRDPGGYTMTSRDLLQDLARRRLEDDTTYKQQSGDCPYQYKVYVYPLDSQLPVVRLAEEARTNRSMHVCRKCILEQFALEYVFHDFFTQFCGRTDNPEEADFFYLPIVRDAEYRWNMHLKMKGAKSPSQAELAILSLLEKNDPKPWKNYFGTTMKYWNRKNGADHIFIMPAPVTNFRHESNMRGFFHFMTHLNPPIFLGLEYSIHFVTEYPICAAAKNIVVPYPVVDPDLYSGKYIDHYEVKMNLKKTALLFYSGGLHGECTPVRKAMREIMHNGSLLPGNIVPKLKKRDMHDREIGFYSSIFCPIPVGDSPSSKRMYDVMNFNCIPVVISDDMVWAFSVQAGGKMDPTTYSIQIPQCIVHWPLSRVLERYDRNSFPTRLPSGKFIYDILLEIHAENKAGEVPDGLNRNSYGGDGVFINPLVQLLQHIPQKDIASLQLGVRNAVNYFLYYKIDTKPHENSNIIPLALHKLPNGGAIDMFSYQLQRIKDTNVSLIHDLCVAEKSRPHQYIGNFRCDRDLVKPVHRQREKFPLGLK